LGIDVLTVFFALNKPALPLMFEHLIIFIDHLFLFPIPYHAHVCSLTRYPDLFKFSLLKGHTIYFNVFYTSMVVLYFLTVYTHALPKPSRNMTLVF